MEMLFKVDESTNPLDHRPVGRANVIQPANRTSSHGREPLDDDATLAGVDLNQRGMLKLVIAVA